MPEDQSEWLGWLIALPQAELIDLLALCSALTVNALPSNGASASASSIAAALGLNMADWWEPTAESDLNHVPKVWRDDLDERRATNRMRMSRRGDDAVVD